MQLSAVVIIVSLLCIGPSLCASADRRVAKQDDADYENDSAVYSIEEDDSEARSNVSSTEIEGERFIFHNPPTLLQLAQLNQQYKPHPLHHFMKKKRPFVSFSTRTETTTVTATVVSTTIGLCAKLVNVTGPCRLRRGLWVEDPIVLSFDDDMDAIDGALLPTAKLSIETTAVPEPITAGRANMEDDSKYLTDSVIQPSSTSVEDEQEDPGGNGNRHIIRDSILALKVFHKLKKRLRVNLITVITTVVSSITSTSTSYVTVSTKTFFIQLCTPSPFPFDICNARKKRAEEAEEKQSKRTT